jgi:hypothetical protein
MKKLVLKLFFFSIPFIIVALIIIRIDPYNYFSWDPQKTVNEKKIARKLNYVLYNLVKYKRNPSSNILLGDSRMGIVNSENILKITGEKYYNFYYGGGTLPEMIETFWFATKCTQIKNAYFGVSFYHFNAYNQDNRVTDAVSILNNPLLYLVNRNVLNATIQILRTKITQQSPQIGKPPMNREKFWNYQLNAIPRIFYENYKYSKKWYRDLEQISEFCRKNNIKLKFIVLPVHTQMQAKIYDYGLSGEYEAYLRDLSKLAVVYDFNIANSWTDDKNNFDDPFHFKWKLTREIISEIWGNQRNWAIIKGKEETSYQF